MVRIVFAYLLLRFYEFALRIYGFNSIFPRFDKTNCKLRAAAFRWPSENLGWRKINDEAHQHRRSRAGFRRRARFSSRISADALRQSFERRRTGRRLQFERDAGKTAL